MTATGGCRVEAYLSLDGAVLGQLKGGNVACQIKRVCPRGGKQIVARVRQRAHVGTIHGPGVGNARRDEGVLPVRVDGHVRRGINDVLAEPVALLHEGVQVVPRGVHGHPAGVVSGVGAFHAADELESRALGGRGRFCQAPVNPELVGLEVCGVEVRF